MITTKHLVEHVRTNLDSLTPMRAEYKQEIIKRLERGDRICHDLEKLIARLSSTLDK